MPAILCCRPRGSAKRFWSSRNRAGIGFALLLAGWIGVAAPGPARCESDLIFPTPEDLSKIAATTFDMKGTAVGESAFWVEQEEPDLFTMRIELAVEGGGVNRSEATFVHEGDPAETEASAASPGEPDEAGVRPSGLRLIEQRSQATRADGVSLPLLVIDHRNKKASCIPSNREDGPARHVDLPEQDRVVNVPLQLLFEPLVTGDRTRLEFQLVLCRKGPVLYDMVAKRESESEFSKDQVVEIQYGPDVGKTFGWLAQKVLPRFAFWFDARRGNYLGHRMPLHTKGPEILLVRHGLQPMDLGLRPE